MDILVGDKVKAQAREEDAYIVGIVDGVALDKVSIGGIELSAWLWDFEVIERVRPLFHRLAEAYGALGGLNRYQRFAKLVEDFGLEANI